MHNAQSVNRNPIYTNHDSEDVNDALIQHGKNNRITKRGECCKTDSSRLIELAGSEVLR